MDDRPTPTGGYRGGAYDDIHKLPHRVLGRPAGDPGLHCHHLIPKKELADAGLDTGRAPSIQVEFPDHVNTATFGTSPAAKRAHALVARMLRAGNLDGAMQFGLDDVRSKPFGPRYELALQEAERYYREEYRSTSLLELDAHRGEQDPTAGPGQEPDQKRQPATSEVISPSSLAALREEMRAWFRRASEEGDQSASNDAWPSRGPARDPGREP